MSETIHNVQPVTTTLGKEGSGEFVPSRYAVQIGEIEVAMISDGVMPLPTSTMATNVNETDRNEWFDGRFLQRDTFDWALNVALVRSGERLILVDSGVGEDFKYFSRAGRTISRLESAGIELAAITDIVITHMHMDHVGGLNAEGVKAKLRPDVRIHVSSEEVKFWQNPDFYKTVMPETIPSALRKAATRFLELYSENIVPFDQTAVVAAGVSARKTGGHTPGHCVVEVASNGEKLTFVGDAIFEVGFDNPEWQNGFEHEPEVATAVRIGLLNDAAETGAMLAATHVAFPSIGHVAKAGKAFRFVPVQWDY